MNEVKERKQNRTVEALDAEVTDLAERCRLKDWSHFIEEIQLPQDVAFALMTSRPELLRIVKPRALSEDEAAKLYKAMAALMETNMALRSHAQQLAKLTDNWANQFAGLHGVGEKIQRFANFKRSYDEVEETV
jgi:hypothetical protein